MLPPDILSNSANGFRPAPVPHRLAALFCLALLAGSCALASLALACATPFAAFAVVAAAMLPLRPALLVVTGTWLVNQAIGFGVLHYPTDGNTILWGLAIGLAALVATLMAAAALHVLPAHRASPALALLCAFAAYQVSLLAATPFLGGASSFAAAIVSRLGLLNAAWLIGLVAVCEIIRLFKPVRRGHAVS
jgi:hypothetical protein